MGRSYSATGGARQGMSSVVLSIPSKCNTIGHRSSKVDSSGSYIFPLSHALLFSIDRLDTTIASQASQPDYCWQPWPAGSSAGSLGMARPAVTATLLGFWRRTGNLFHSIRCGARRDINLAWRGGAGRQPQSICTALNALKTGGKQHTHVRFPVKYQGAVNTFKPAYSCAAPPSPAPGSHSHDALRCGAKALRLCCDMARPCHTSEWGCRGGGVGRKH